jgi:hypothetical protein
MRIVTHSLDASRASRANWLLVIPAAIVAALSFLMLWPMAEVATPSVPINLRCISADRAAATRLTALLENPAMRDARRIDRAVHGLITARTHCAYGWIDQSLGEYAAIEPTAMTNAGTGQCSASLRLLP